jgi:hypothetical protein
MPGPHRKPSKRSVFHNTLPAGEVKELGEATGWAEWNQALEHTDRQFAPTAPMTAPHPPEGGDRRYAKTEPAALSTERAVTRRLHKITADQVMVEARKNNRVCPKPRRWAALFGQFAQWAPESAEMPSPPLSGDSWHRTPALAKRMAFRDHIEWAERQGCLAQTLEFLKALAEDDWHHMGE